MRIGDIVEVAGQVAVRFGAVAVGLLAGTCTFSLLLLTFNLARAEAHGAVFTSIVVMFFFSHAAFLSLLLVALFGEALGLRALWLYALAWALTATSVSSMDTPGIFPPLHLDWYAQNVEIVWFVSGFGAGAAYWLVTGRKAGRWLGTTRAKATGLKSPP